MDFIFYIIPIFPLIIRFLFISVMKGNLKEILKEEENDRAEIRSYILALGGFSFTALVGFIVLEPAIKQNIQFSIYYVFISFISYFFALNLQGYKSKRWHDIISDALIETASLCLILTVISLLFVSNLNEMFTYIISILAIFIWLIDFIIRLNIQINYLNQKGV